MVKHLPTLRETRVWALGREDPLEKEMATHSSTLAWKIPWIEEPGRLQSMGSQSRTRLSDFTSLHFMQYCSLQHQTLLPLPVTTTTGCCCRFSSVSSFFLELFLHWSPVAYWTPTDLGSSSFSVPSVFVFMPLMGFSRQEYWSGLPFPSPVDHILSELEDYGDSKWDFNNRQGTFLFFLLQH